MSEITGTLCDPTLQPTPLELGGKTYHLLFNLGALAKAQKATGINFMQGFTFADMGAEQYVQLLHAGLAKFHPEIKVEDLLELDMRQFNVLIGAITAAFGAAQPDDPANPPSPAPAE